MFRTGLSTNAKILNEDLFIQYEKAGISAMELSMVAEELDEIDYKEIKGWADAHNVELWSLHLPFNLNGNSNIADFDDTVRKNTIEYFSDIIKKASAVGIKIFVIHPSYEPVEEDENRETRMKLACEMLDMLAEIAHEHGSVIAVENLPRTCLGRNSEEILTLLKSNDKLKVCYDTNHLLIQDAVEFIKAVGDKIVTLHVSDYDFINERHWLPGEGKNDWQKIINALKEVGYSGVWLYEVAFTNTYSIIRNRDLTCYDFALNAKELFENKELTTIAKPKENLGMWG